MTDKILWPLIEEAVFTIVYQLGPIKFKDICEDALRISSTGKGPCPIIDGKPTPTQPKWRKVDALLKKLSNGSLIEFTRPAGWVAVEQVKDESIIADILLCISGSIQVPDETVIRGWTPWERAQVISWAWRYMFRASDNNVRVPPRPEVLKGFDA